MSFHSLPPELLDAVCEYLPIPDLARLSYTSIQFCQVAERHLYRHVAIAPARGNVAVVLTLARKPQVARHVRSFSIDLDSYTTLLRSYYHKLARAISFMTQLVSLHVFVDPGATWILQSIQTSFPRLLHFACSFSFDSHVSSFLQRTPALLELEVDSIPSPHQQSVALLSESSIPRLSQFIGSSQAAVAVVPTRPVHSIHLTSGDLTEAVVMRLADSSAPVAVLGATTSSTPAALLNLLSEKMQHLVYLRLMTTYNFSEAPNVDFYERVASSLNALPDLQGFELCGMHWGSHKRDEDETKRVWQSQPLGSDVAAAVDDTLDIDVYSDLFFAY